MSDEAALLKAVIANAGDDTPRLVYADWLDEHDAPIQAEYIRVQCRLASASAADPDYPDLLERSAELTAQFGPMLKLTAPPLPPGFKHEDDFRRGFLHAAGAEWYRESYREPNQNYYRLTLPTDEQLDRVCAGLADLTATTTVRHLDLGGMLPDALVRVLTEPAARALTGLTISASDYDATARDALVRTLARSPIVANLERLELNCSATVSDLSALGANPDRLRALNIPPLAGRTEDMPALARTPWFRGLREVRMRHVERTLQEPLLAALADLPRLETFDAVLRGRTAFKALGTANGFPELARLRILSPAALDRVAIRLARGRFSRLSELTMVRLSDEILAPLLGAKWGHQLRVFTASGESLTDRSARALARCPAAPHLRVLRLWRNRFAKAGLAALGDGARFPNLTTLDIDAAHAKQVRPETVARFAAELSLPRIRHLRLDGWPLGDAGAKALAANPHLANLTRLSLNGCKIGDRGFTALARSKHLRNLIELNVGNSNLKRAAALLDPDAFPRLARLDLQHNPIKPTDREALRRARGWLV